VPSVFLALNLNIFEKISKNLNIFDVQVAKATVQVSKRTAFGALFGKPAAGRKPNLLPGLSNDQVVPVASSLSGL
jgi:hypothetical protein